MLNHLRPSYLLQSFALALGLAAGSSAAAQTLSLDAGPLTVGSQNTEFIVYFYNDGNGLERPVQAVLSNGTFIDSAQPTSWAISSQPNYTLNFTFSVASPALLTQNPIYLNQVYSNTATVSLFAGSDFLWEAVRIDDPLIDTSNYLIPATPLQPDTVYRLVINTHGLPSPSYAPVGNVMWAQIAVDVAPVPEPGSPVLLGLGLGLLALGRGYRGINNKT